MLLQHLLVDVGARGRDDDGGDEFAPFGLRDADDADLLDARMLAERGLHLVGLDRFAAGADHLLDPADDRKNAVVVEPADVAGAEPVVLEDLCGQVGPFPVAHHDVGAANENLAGLAGRGGAATRRQS